MSRLPDSAVLGGATQAVEHLSGYQRRDFEIVDYGMYELPGTGLSFRGPGLESCGEGNYFTCIGAAQTFGCFCERPFPEILAAKLGIPALNLGYGGAGPEFFERQSCLDQHVNGGRFLVLQVMSGRSQSNSVFECKGLEYTRRRSDGMSMSADAAYNDLMWGVPALGGGKIGLIAQKVFRRAFQVLRFPKALASRRLKRIVEETRVAWVESYTRFLARVEVPVVLFWFSKREPSYPESERDVYSLFGEFPQLVNQSMVDRVRANSDAYVHCVTSRGSPQPLFNRWTGLPAAVNPANDRPDFAGAPTWTKNVYYPSPEMHEDAAEALLPVCTRLLSERRPS